LEKLTNKGTSGGRLLGLSLVVETERYASGLQQKFQEKQTSLEAKWRARIEAEDIQKGDTMRASIWNQDLLGGSVVPIDKSAEKRRADTTR
jgi:hypothetical protein